MKIKAGLIGAGWSAKAQAWSISSLKRTVRRKEFPEVVLEIVLSRTPSHAEEMARQFGFKKWTTSETEFFNSDLDLVAIATPNNTHFPLAVKALERNFNVVLEKPVALNFEEARDLERYALKSGRSVAVCLVSRFMPGIRYIRELVQSGQLGDFLEFRGVIAHAKHAYRDTPFEWRMSKAIAGGGVFTDIGVHVLDLSEYLPATNVQKIFGKSFTLIEERLDPSTGTRRKIDTEDVGFAILEYEKGRAGNIEASKVSPGFEEQMRIEIYGTEGGARFSLSDPHIVYIFRRETKSMEKIIKGYEEIYPDLVWPVSKSFEGWVYSYLILYKQFIEYLAGLRENYQPTLKEGIRSQQLLDAFYLSSIQGRWIEV
jgi:predicted dehydrogenase